MAYELFNSAIKSMEEGENFLRKKHYEKSVRFIRKSSIDLARSLILITETHNSGETLDNGSIVSEVNRLYHDNNLQYLEPVIAALNFNSSNDESIVNKDKLHELYSSFNESIIATRKAIVKETNYNVGLIDFINKHFLSLAALKRISLIVVPILLLVSALLYIYQQNQPEHTANLTGEVFWKPDNQTPFNLGFARKFPVRQGGSMNEYLVDLGKTYSIYSFRFDPVHDKHLAIIEIEWIRFLDIHGRLAKEINPGNLRDWQCHSCSKISSTDQAHRIKVTGKDPYLTSSIIGIDDVAQAVIRMRVLSRKSFWEWLLGIDQ